MSSSGTSSVAQRPGPGSPAFIPIVAVSWPSFGTIPQAIRRQTGVRLWALNRSCSLFAPESAFFPTNRATLLLSGPPRRSQRRQRSKNTVGSLKILLKMVFSCSESGEARGQSPTRPRTSILSLSRSEDLGEASMAAKEHPILCAIRTTPCFSPLKQCSSMALSTSSASAAGV